MSVHSQATVDEVLRLWNDGISAGNIAFRPIFGLRLSRNAVIGIVDRARKRLGRDKVRSAAPATLQRPRKPRVMAVRPERPAPQPVVIETRPVALLERRRDQCVWPLWPHEETGAPDFMVCGAERFGEAPLLRGACGDGPAGACGACLEAGRSAQAAFRAGGVRGLGTAAEGRRSVIEDSPGAIWLDAFVRGRGQVLLNEILGLDSAAKRHAAAELGLTVARVEVLGDSWREAAEDGPGVSAVLLPVGVPAVFDRVVNEFCGSCLRVDVLDPRSVQHLVADVIAISDAPRSLTGMTGAVGTFAVAEDKCRLLTEPLRFLRRYIERFLSGDERLPCEVDTLIVDRDVFEWRVAAPGCVVPRDCSIACLDSGELAAWLVKEMRRREVGRRPPAVVAPVDGVARHAPLAGYAGTPPRDAVGET